MHNARRGIRNVWRSKVRTITVTLLIALAMCLSITMMAIDSAVDSQLGTIEASVGTQVEVRPAGTFGSFGSGEPLSEAILEGMDQIPNIVEIAPVLVYQYMQRQDSGTREGTMAATRNRMAIMGIQPSQALRIMGGGEAEIVDGRNFTAEDNDLHVIIVGQTYAEERELAVGSVVNIGENSFEVVGISLVGSRFGDTSVFLPLSTAQRVLDMEGQLTQVYVTVDSLPNLTKAVAALSTHVGDQADVVAQGEATMQRVTQSMDLVRGTTGTGLWLALGTCGLVIFFTMVLIIRERQREIGVLKAIGSSNFDLLSGFAWESLALAALGAVIGILLFTTVGQSIAGRVMAQTVTAPAVPSGIAEPGMAQGMFGGGQGSDRASRFMMQGGFLQSQLGDVTVSLSLGLLARSLAAALGLGLLGGVLPALYALRLKPAEVLRND
ncbi:MAG: FtsX-like permease family protein [Bacillota bacterium]|nr:FtsX-like permease family protein [Bacillota bacterium]